MPARASNQRLVSTPLAVHMHCARQATTQHRQGDDEKEKSAIDSVISQRWEVMREALDERQRRLLVGVEAKVLGRGGVAAVALATGVSRTTIRAGLSEIEATGQTAQQTHALTGRTRQAGAGRKKIELKDSIPLNTTRIKSNALQPPIYNTPSTIDKNQFLDTK